MPRSKGVLKAARDKVKCSFCNKVIERRYIDNHWRRYRTQLPIHPSDVSSSQMAVEIIPTSNILNWVKPQTQQPISDDNKENQLGAPQTPPPFRAPLLQSTIHDVFKKISKDVIERNKLMTESGHLISSIGDLLQSLKQNNRKMNIDMFVEGDSTDYDSVFDLLLQSKIVFQI